MRAVYTFLTLLLLSQAPAALAGCAIAPDGSGHVTIPDTQLSIGDQAFYGCTALTSITIPDSVTSIGDYAFDSTSLTSVTIPDSVTSIGAGAFYKAALTSVTIPDSVTSIDSLAFGFPSLTSITFMSSGVTLGYRYSMGILANGDSLNQICGVDATIAPFNSMGQTVDQSTQAQCTEPACPAGVSGVKWCADPPACASPDTTGYAVTETDLALDSFDVTATCAPLYEGTASVAACSADGEAYLLSGCSCDGFTPLGGVCTAYRSSCPDNEYLSGGTATADKDCIPCAADEKSYGGAPCKKIVDCLSATEQGHRNIDVGYENGDYAVSMS